MKKKTFLLVGGAGYIGSQIAWLLNDLKQNIIIVDNLSTGNLNFLPSEAKIFQGNHQDEKFLNIILEKNKIDVVIQLAASIKVGESVQKPLEYYDNNINGILTLLKLIDKFKIPQLIFSSTAAVYGNGEGKALNEEDIKNPINPYGFSKLSCERIIQDFAHINKEWFKYGILRYFNVAGADPLKRTGIFCKKNQYSLLIPVISNAILNNKEFTIFGNDYPTKDGTCIRDYIHVHDLARAHIEFSNYLDVKNNESNIFNVGSNHGYSNLEIINTFSKILDSKINFNFGSKRDGDPVILIADNQKIKNTLNFITNFNLENIIKHEIEWRKKLFKKNNYFLR